MTAWPNTLPSAPLANGFHEAPPDAVLRTPMDQGPAKLRRRTTAEVRLMACGYILTRAQVAALDSFYLSDLGGGVLPFTFTHPRSGATLSCRFRSPPAYVSITGEDFHATVELEVLP